MCILHHPEYVTRDAERVPLAYTPDAIWRNRSSFLTGRSTITAFLIQKWQHELDYRLRKELFAWHENRIAVQFWYEYRDAEEAKEGREVWKRCYGIEHWTFEKSGKMRKRMMSGNEIKIAEGQRWFTEGVDVNKVEIGEQHW